MRRPVLAPRPGGWALAWHDTHVDMSGIALAFLDPDGGLAAPEKLVASGRMIGSFAVAEAGARVALAAFELWSAADPAGKDLVRGTPFLKWFDASGVEVGMLDLRLP